MLGLIVGIIFIIRHCSGIVECLNIKLYTLRRNILPSTDNNTLSSLPLVCNLSAVLFLFENFMLPECLFAVRKALVAYYDRLEQFNKLKETLKHDAQLFKILDGTHFQIKFAARSEMQEPDEQIGFTLILDYSIFDIRPMQCSFVEKDLPDGALEALMGQCAVFEREPLHEAFREAFIDGVGPYAILQRIGVQPFEDCQKPKQSHVAYPFNAIDDIFH